jgi:small nuclear ribonucleoprotein (snRNP)-like protein
MEKYIENIQTVHELKRGVSGLINETLNELRDAKALLKGNRLLTEEGKREEEKKLQAKYEKTFLGKMREVDNMVNLLLDESKDETDKVLTAALPPVEETKQKLFDLELKKAEGQVMFAIGAQQATKALEQLVESATEPLLAQQALDKFISLSMPALSLAADTERAALKQRLGSLYQQLDTKAQVEGAQGAREALSTINALKGAGYVTGYVQDALKEISMKSYEYVNSPKAYFEKL